jgi:uncharacterized membrane protein (DUF485 family)
METHERRLHAIAASRWRIAFILSGIMLVAYYGFILLVAADVAVIQDVVKAGGTIPPGGLKDQITLGIRLGDGLSVGILLGALVIVFAWLLTSIYVAWANNVYDREIDDLNHLSR